MKVRSAGQASRHWVIQAVHISEPPLSSPAALALLSKIYYTKDKSIYSEMRMCRVRKKWMKNLMKDPLNKANGLTCALCGKSGLRPFNQHVNKIATLDHIIELKCGGSWKDPTNFQVACWHCNNAKNRDLPKVRA